MRKILRNLIFRVAKLIVNLLLCTLKADQIETLCNSVMRKCELLQKVYITYHMRPQDSTAVNTWSQSFFSQKKIGIVIQGPIKQENNFTLESIRIYKKNFNSCLIILSTWEDEDEHYIRRCKDDGIEILLNKKPQNPGIQNINNQIVSTMAGLRRLKELGIEYALKTRTDQRMYGRNLEMFLFSTIKTFPLSINCGQKERIVAASLNTFKYRPYSISDMMLFGHIDDLLLYWSADFDESSTLPISDLAKWLMTARVNEIYLTSRFLSQLGRQLKWTVADSWKMYADHFCVVDSHSLDLFWSKYEHRVEFRSLCYDYVRSNELLSFKEWLCLYQMRQQLKEISESVLEKDFGDPIFWENKIKI